MIFQYYPSDIKQSIPIGNIALDTFLKVIKNPKPETKQIFEQILIAHENNDLKLNVLDDQNLRESIKTYSNWPTIPQIYIKGQFVGGCDILKEMHADGSLEELLIRENIIKAQLAEK